MKNDSLRALKFLGSFYAIQVCWQKTSEAITFLACIFEGLICLEKTKRDKLFFKTFHIVF